MTLPEDDVAARGRSIFERLRAEQEAAVAAAAQPEETPPPAGVVDAAGDRSSADDATTPAGSGGTPAAVFSWASLPLADEPSAATRMVLRVASPSADAAPPGQDVPEDTVPAAADAFDPPLPEEIPAVEVAPEPATTGTGAAARFAPTPPVMPDLPPLAPGPPAAAGEVPVSATIPEPEEPAPATLPPPAAVPTAFARDLPRIIAVANQKGGVGKTTTTVNLGASLAVLGYRVLVVDLDPQGNATTGLGINSRNLEHSIYDVILHDVAMDDCVEPTSLRNLYVAPATIDLAGAEIELVPAFSRELRLKRALDEVRDDFDFVLIDCPPSLGLLTVNGLAAANEVLVPIQCEYYALEGLGQLLRNVNLVQSNLNPQLEMSAIVLTMYDARTKLAEQVAAEVRTHFGPRVCRNIIPRTVRLSEAPSFGQPIIVFDPTSRGALAYRELAKEVSGGTPQRVG